MRSPVMLLVLAACARAPSPTHVIDDSSLRRVGPERALTGTYRRFTWPQGSKLAGESALQFVAEDGTAYLLAHGPGAPALGAKVTVHAQVVEPSPGVARPRGPYLWIFDP